MDLGYKDIKFTFIGFNFETKETKSSFYTTAMIFIAKNKFKRKGSKAINMDNFGDLGDLGDWEQFFQKSQESIDLGLDL